MKKISDIKYKGSLGLDLYLPDCKNFPLFIYFHGGGLESGNKVSDADFAPDVANAGIAVASVDYSMYPSAKYPDFIVDAADSIAYMKMHISEYGNCTGIYVGGSSAGAFITMMLNFDEEFLRNVGVKQTDIAGWIHDSGQPTKHFNVLNMEGEDGKRIIVDEKAPLYWVGLNKEQLSRMLFLVSDNDMHGRYEQLMLMMSTLRHFGIGEDIARIEVLQGTHCSHLHRTDLDGKNAFGKIIVKFILG